MSGNDATAALIGFEAPGVGNEHLPHRSRCQGEKVGSVLPLHALDVDQLEIRLVDEGRRREGMARPLPAQALVGPAPQVVVDQRKQLVQGAAVSAPPGGQESRGIGLKHVGGQS